VHGEATLEAGQSITKMVNMEDCLGVHGKGARRLGTRPKRRPASSRAASAQKGGHRHRVEEKVQENLKQEGDRRQARGADSVYRQGLGVITTIEQDLAAEKLTEGPRARRKGVPRRRIRHRLLAGSADTPRRKGAPSPVHLHDHCWQIIFAILAFLGLETSFF